MLIDARVMGCGFGGVGPLALPGVPNAWVIALVEISPHGGGLSRVRIARVTLLDGDEVVLAHAIDPIGVRVAPSTRSRFDFSEAGTALFGGAMASTTLLRVNATLDTRAEDLYPKASATTRVRVDIVADDGLQRVVEGAASPWSTA